MLRRIPCPKIGSYVCYSVVNLLRIVIHCSKYSDSVQNVVIHYIFSSESLRVVISLQSSKFTVHTVFSTAGSFGYCWEKGRIHRPAPVQNLSLQKKMGATEERFRWWIWSPWFFIGFLYPPPAWKVFFEARKVLQKIFFRWWLCTLCSSLGIARYLISSVST